MLLGFLIEDPNVPRRDYGGNGMLVDHLADGILQENDKLVEGLDLSLQLDAVDEVDGNGYALPTQGVQEWLL
jgi:hypothetical protein